MKNLITKLAVAATASAALSFAVSDSASAASFPLRSPQVTLGPSEDGSTNSLQNIFNRIDGDTNPPNNINAFGDQSAAQLFTPVDKDGIATLIIEVAGFQNTNTFGLYDSALNTINIFAGTDAAISKRIIEFNSTTNTVTVKNTDNTVFSSGTLNSLKFGFFLKTQQNNTFYTEDFRNQGGKIQALVYEGNNDPLDIDQNGSEETRFDMGKDFLIAWEDKKFDGSLGTNSDEDYNDMVVLVQDVQGVPEPLTMLGVGTAIGFGGFFKRELSKKQKKKS